MLNFAVEGNRILIIYGAVVLNRMLSGILIAGKTDRVKELEMEKVFLNVAAYCVALGVLVLFENYIPIPEFGLTKSFLLSANYNGISEPHFFMCLGVSYSLILIVIDIYMIKRLVHDEFSSLFILLKKSEKI
jgi:hypothetical protein